MKKCLLLTIAVILSSVLIGQVMAGEELEHTQKDILGLKIVNFTEDSNLKAVGAQLGDIIITYNGEKVEDIKHLGELKEAVETSEVYVFIKRDEEEIEFTIPKGQIGVYLKEVVPEYKIDNDAVIIEGLGKLGWGIGMENSFLGAVYRMDEKFGQNIKYEDIVGLSGYGFRILFYDAWCPSSPDATCGKDVGIEILQKLGYKSEAYTLQSETAEEDNEEYVKTEDELREIIMKSIDEGWPVIALDLIEVPEWGLVTGYQKEGKEFFCRTYFDNTEGYEIAQKMPWVIYTITDKQEVNIMPEYRNSLLLAEELYNTEKYDSYFSGIKAIEEWVKALKDEEHFTEADEEQLGMTLLTNWWIYYSLTEARNNAKGYLLNNKEKFEFDIELIDSLAVLYGSEVEILQNGFQYVSSPHTGKSPSEWNSEMRANQIETLEELLGIENEVNSILRVIR